MKKPFEGVENLEAAYDLETPEDNINFMQPGPTPMTRLRACMDYILHRQVGETYHAVGGGPKVLDIGAGTGALAEVMVPLGPYDMDATDISQQMLNVAAQKDLYHRVFWSDVTDACPLMMPHMMVWSVRAPLPWATWDQRRLANCCA